MRLITLAVALLLATSASAAPKHWYNDKKWWAGEAIIGAAVFLDMHSTARALSNPANVETNMLLGPHPSPAKLTAFGFGAFGYWTVIHAIDWHFFHNDSRPFRIAGALAAPASALAIHLPAAIHNYQLPAAVQLGMVRP